MTADPMRAALDVFERAGHDPDPDELAYDLAEIADKTSGSFIDALRADTGPIAALSNLLVVTAALSAALGLPPTPLPSEVVDAVRNNPDLDRNGVQQTLEAAPWLSE